jgi:hypothetical protein
MLKNPMISCGFFSLKEAAFYGKVCEKYHLFGDVVSPNPYSRKNRGILRRKEHR